MSDEPLADIFGSGSEDKFYDQMNTLTDITFKQVIQHSKLNEEEVRQYSDYFMIAEQMDMLWLKEVAINDILLKKSRDGWLVNIKTSILQRISGAIDTMSDGVGQVSQDIKKAFSGVS